MKTIEHEIKLARPISLTKEQRDELLNILDCNGCIETDDLWNIVSFTHWNLFTISTALDALVAFDLDNK